MFPIFNLLTDYFWRHSSGRKINRARDIILNYYSLLPTIQRKPLIKTYDCVFSSGLGLGDALCASSFFHSAKEQNQIKCIKTSAGHFHNLRGLMPDAIEEFQAERFPLGSSGEYDVGNGMLSQRFQRILGLTPDLKPRNRLVTKEKVNKKKIAICFRTGQSAFHKTAYQHPRQLTPESIPIIQEFINQNSHKYQFVEFGQKKFGLSGVTDKTGLDIVTSAIELSKCQYYIGLNSGFMHLANAFWHIKCVILVNIPHVEHLYLPVLRDCKFADDIEWLPPHHPMLFMGGSNEIVPELSIDNLHRALNDEVYPYGREECLELVFEKDFLYVRS
jgi:hypothetical protein